MERRNSKEWRRSRSTSFLDNIATPPASPRRAVSSTRRVRRFSGRNRVTAALVIAGGSVIFILVLLLRSGGTASPRATSNVVDHLVHPNFDFDHHLAEELAHKEALDREDEWRREHSAGSGSRGTRGEIEENAGDADEDDNDEDDSHLPQWTQVSSPDSRDSTLSVLPFLPYSCDTCSSASPLDASAPVCSKYRPRSTKPSSLGPKSFQKSSLVPDVLDHSVMFAGTGADVRRVLKRAMKSSLYGTKREREGKEGDLTKFEGEEPFRILILGGSVSNCRGVDQKTTCWHAGLLRWFQQTLPMEGDRDLVPDLSSLLVTEETAGPTRLDGVRVKRSLVPAPQLEDPATDAKPHVKRVAHKAGKGRKKKKAKKKVSTSRQRPSTRLINGSKSATGSSFFAYCYDEEMNLRGKNVELGKGPDLVILEYGVNDVHPHDEVATRDFEKHLRALRSLPTKPAVIVLEAASLLLASTTSFTQNAEYLHLPAAQFYDVPVLSAKQALFGPHSPFTPSSPLAMPDLFLPDQHHPNDKGHEFLSDVLISYLERQACLAQAEILDVHTSRSNSAGLYVDPERDIGKRTEETATPLPSRSLFTPFPTTKGQGAIDWTLPQPRCIQVGNSKSTHEPISNSGWEKFGWARDKQYLIADKPGSSVTYEVEVGEGGTILADWLRSRFYDLGDVSVYLDDDKAKAVTLAGYWNLGWSIGVPTEIFTSVAAGLHRVTFEILPSSQSSHPSKKTSFRLIGIIST